MINKETMLKVIDNSGARYARVIGMNKNCKRYSAYLGSIVVVTVREIIKSKSIVGVEKGKMFLAYITSTRANFRSKLDGNYIKSNSNTCILLDRKYSCIASNWDMNAYNISVAHGNDLNEQCWEFLRKKRGNNDKKKK